MRRIKRGSGLTEQTADRIRMAILRGDLAPGTRVRQEELAARLAVSRAPVRQALVLLQREGVIEIDPSRGAAVARLDADLIRDLYDFREGVERHVAETLARRDDVAWATIRDIVAAGRSAISSDDVSISTAIDLDLRFHTALYEAVGNRILCDVMRGQWINMRRVIAATLTLEGYARQIWDEHAAILDAIMSHDAARAGALSAAHTRTASARLIANHTRVNNSGAEAIAYSASAR